MSQETIDDRQIYAACAPPQNKGAKVRLVQIEVIIAFTIQLASL